MTSASRAWRIDATTASAGVDEGACGARAAVPAQGLARAAGAPIVAVAARRARSPSRCCCSSCCCPFLWLVQLAFRPAADIFDDSLLFVPTLDGFISLLQGNFLKSFGNSLLVSTLSTGLLAADRRARGLRARRAGSSRAATASRCGSW